MKQNETKVDSLLVSNNINNQLCSNCLQPQVTEDGIVDFIDDLCQHCHEHREYAKVLADDCRQSGDFDFSMNY